MNKFMVVAFQTGCANNLVPIVIELLYRENIVDVFCTGGAMEVFQKNNVPVIAVDDSLSVEDAEDMIDLHGPDMLITGSNSNLLEFNFRLAAKNCGVKSVTFLDFWNKYEERFFNGGVSSVPDLVLVIDDTMKDGMSNIGIDNVKVVGSPHFERLHEFGSLMRQKKIRNRNLLFCSQPILDLYGKEWGYNEFTIFFDCVVPVLKDMDVMVTVKLHPRENDEMWKKYFRLYRIGDNYKIESGGDMVGLMWKSDLVFGMPTTALIEAVILGKESLSLQVGSNDVFRFFGTVSGIVPTVTSVEDFKNYMDGFMSGKRTYEKNISCLYDRATEKCVNEILGVLG